MSNSVVTSPQGVRLYTDGENTQVHCTGRSQRIARRKNLYRVNSRYPSRVARAQMYSAAFGECHWLPWRFGSTVPYAVSKRVRRSHECPAKQGPGGGLSHVWNLDG